MSTTLAQPSLGFREEDDHFGGRHRRSLQRSQVLVRAIEALDTIEATAPMERAITWLGMKG